MRTFFVALGWLLASHAHAETVGLKDSQQIFASLSIMTEIPLTDGDVQAVYAARRERLGRYGSVNELSVPMLLSVLSVADVYCRKWLERESGMAPSSRRVHGDVNFAASPVTVSSDIREALLKKYAQLFWQRLPTNFELSELDTLYVDTAAALTGPSRTIAKTLQPVCMHMVGSLAFLTN